MTDISHTMAQLQQLVIDERKRWMDMEHKLSSAQDKIGIAGHQTRDLTSKNKQLTSEVESWTAAYNTQTASAMQTNLVASGSGVSNTTQTMPQVSMTVPLSLMMTTPLNVPQGPLPRIDELQRDDRGLLGPQGNRRVSFGSVFDAPSRQNNGEHGNDWDETLGGDTVQPQQNISMFKLEIKSKDPPMFYGRAAEDVSTCISKVSDFFYLTGATDCQQVAYVATLL